MRYNERFITMKGYVTLISRWQLQPWATPALKKHGLEAGEEVLASVCLQWYEKSLEMGVVGV
jgi:hypothetical protein